MSCIIVQAGQCGNQLGYSILDKLYTHFDNESLSPDLNKKRNTEKQKSIFFRRNEKKKTMIKYLARAVCFDTEPKVINECVRKSASSAKWTYDNKSISYLHGGAGNNWAQGYEMCSNEFLESSLDCVRHELEHCDYSPFLLICHSLAGGTGSGLGTKITEVLSYEFPDVMKINLAIIPYSSFNEIIVQYYNAILSLAKLTSTCVSDGVILYENEIAQYLCKNIAGIERPTMADINNIISSHIAPILLPKYNQIYSNNNNNNNTAIINEVENSQTFLSDDIRHLCQNPSYKLLDIKYVPQTFQKSIDYTYDTWSSLLNTINRMQTKGSFTERGLFTSSSSATRLYTTMNTSPVPDKNNSNNSYSSSNVKTIASVLTFHGDDAVDAFSSTKISVSPATDNSSFYRSNHRNSTGEIARKNNSNTNNNFHSQVVSNSLPSTSSSSSSSVLPNLQFTPYHCENIFYSNDLYTFPVSTTSNNSTASSPSNSTVKSHYTFSKQVNGYHRSISLLSNSDNIVPFLDRMHTRASELFQNKAYIHQYQQYGVEETDFIQAFHQVGQIIHNYQNIS